MQFSLVSVLLCALVGMASATWKLTWSDEFDGTALDTSKWSAPDNYTHGDLELQLYLESEVTVANGSLVLTTNKRDARYGSKLYHYTSGQVNSAGKFSQLFGRFEVRAKIPSPKVHCSWPAHWMMPEPEDTHPPNVCWPMGGEIDIMECMSVGTADGRILGTPHWGDGCNQDQCGQCSGFYPPLDKPTMDMSLDFHVYAAEWNTTTITWFVDGMLYHTATRETMEVPQTPFYMILNTAICWWDPPRDGEVFPQQHFIDYVRVYQQV